MNTSRSIRVLALVAVGIATAACTSSGASTNATNASANCKTPETPVITLAAYSTPREAYGKIIPAFQEEWAAKHDGQTVIFQESYGGSGSQAENVVNGFEADVVALSLDPDVQVVEDAGLITHDWRAEKDGGMVSSSVVVFDVRPGNPQNIEDFDDLARPGLEVLTPDPASSGGARWNILGAYGSALRGFSGSEKGDEQGAQDLLEGIFSNVTVMDKTARDSIKNFESGNGDVAITYENEVLTAQEAGLEDEMVIPPSTILIENPVAVVDEYAAEHCVTEVANAFVDFLHTEEAKALYKDVGFLRPTDPKAAQRGDGDTFPRIKDLFTIEDLGGWDAVNNEVFGDSGAFTEAFEKAQG